eukprot:6186374-Pleurochrysis_carterae.AAC.2
MVWEQALTRGLGAPTGVASVRGAINVATGTPELGSGARALRKYACDATAIRETMHESVMKHERAKRKLISLEVEKLNDRPRSRCC